MIAPKATFFAELSHVLNGFADQFRYAGQSLMFRSLGSLAFARFATLTRERCERNDHGLKGRLAKSDLGKLPQFDDQVQRNQSRASTKLPTPQTARMHSSCHCDGKVAPSSVTARSESINGVSGKALMKGCAASGEAFRRKEDAR